MSDNRPGWQHQPTPPPPPTLTPTPPGPDHLYWVYPPQQEPAKGLSIGALVCGIVGVTLGLVPILFVASLPLALVAIVLGFIAWRKRQRAGVGRAMAVWGVSLGTVALMLAVAGIVIVNNTLNDVSDDLEQIEQDLQDDLDDLDTTP